MCTITYYPYTKPEEGFIITDNRDESIRRPSLPPDIYKELGTKLCYPKDLISGGTWFGVSKQKRIVCLMNGAFKPHKRAPAYQKSRGIVVKEFLATPDTVPDVQHYNFNGIEPFYAVLFSWYEQIKIHEIIWDGEQPFVREVEAGKPHIWASSMTYSHEQYRVKKEKFSALLETLRPQADVAESLWQLHHSEDKNGVEGYMIKRGMLQTTSIIQIHFRSQSDISYRYHDLLKNELVANDILWT